MNRRSFLKSTAALATASLVPSWLLPKPPVNLSAFCWNERHEPVKYQGMVRPFTQYGTVDDKIGRKPWQQKMSLPGSHSELFRYATDSRICVRVPGADADKTDGEECRLPPAKTLPWTHDWAYQGQWLKWPKEHPLKASKTECPRCHGYGCEDGMTSECVKCEGAGQVWVGSNYAETYAKCPACKDRCQVCNGQAQGVYPGIQAIGDAFVALEYDAKIRTNLQDVEWFSPAKGFDNSAIIKFRFDGGCGLLAALDRKEALERLKCL